MTLSPQLRLKKGNKMNKLNKLGLVIMLAIGIVGCASIGGIANKYVNNDKVEGIIYGAGLEQATAKSICDSIGNKDDRCNESEKYKVVAVAAKFGFSDAFTGIYAFAPIEMDTGKPCRTGSKDCSYLKAIVEKGKLGTVLEVASRPGDGKCNWSGMPRAGGTVCSAYDYDYRKDFNGIPR